MSLRSLLRVGVLALATTAQAWEATIGEGNLDDGFDVVVDAAGDVVTAGGVAIGGQDFAVVKLDGLTGGEIWRYVASGSLGEPDYADQVAVDGSSDVFASGYIREPGTEASVVKLDGTTGAEIWRRDLPDTLSPGTATWLVVTGSGDVVVATGVSVRRLDGASGADVWAAGTGSCLGGPLAIQAAGDVIATHWRSQSLPDGEMCRRDAASGTIVWSTNLGDTSVLDVDLDGADDVVIAGHFDNGLNWTAAKLDGATGGVAWRVDAGLNARVNAVAVDSSGDVIVGGLLAPSNTLLAKLDGTSGATLWQEGISAVIDVAVDGNDDVITAEVSLGTIGLVRKVAGTDGSFLWRSHGGFPVDLDAAGQPVSLSDPLSRGWRVAKTGGPLTGRSFLVYDTTQSTKLVVKAKDSAVLYPLAGLSPGTFGATLEILNPTTLEGISMPLPAAGWVVSSNTATYSDKEGTFGPCSKVKLKREKLLRAVCKGIAFTLNEPMQGSLRATLELAGDPRSRQCVEFGGTVTIDAPGTFKALDSPPPATCP